MCSICIYNCAQQRFQGFYGGWPLHEEISQPFECSQLSNSRRVSWQRNLNFVFFSKKIVSNKNRKLRKSPTRKRKQALWRQNKTRSEGRRFPCWKSSPLELLFWLGFLLSKLPGGWEVRKRYMTLIFAPLCWKIWNVEASRICWSKTSITFFWESAINLGDKAVVHRIPDSRNPAAPFGWFFKGLCKSWDER